MPSTVKKTKRKPSSTRRKSTADKSADILAAPITKSEPAYININERSAELAAKNRLLWTVVAVFSIILAIFWLIVLRANIAKETDKIGLSQIGEQISASLARFDTEIKDRAVPKEITSEDMAAIKNVIEEQIKSNPDSSTWPTHEFTNVRISIQYPTNWNNAQVINELILSDAISTATTSINYGKISIISKSNPNKYDIAAWLKAKNITNKDYAVEHQLFLPASSSTESLIFNSTSFDSNKLDKIIYINSVANKLIWEIKITAAGDLKYYEPLIMEIIRTIKILK